MTAPGNQPSPAPGTYEIDQAASAIRFDTRALFGLLPVRGTFTIGQGRIIVADPAEESSVDVVVEAGSFASGKRQRDEHVRSADYLDVARHPGIGFRSLRLERSGEDATLHGELTVRGVTLPLAVTLGAVAQEGRRLTASGTATVDRYAFGITKAKGMTGRHLKITLDVVAYR
ncbi:YceI family protein [Streptomyces tagetis]|uniref:YceI family protein n=1 Tax=Streptomyces tagetis TaxID=2820809 RepID=A0A940XJZ5_9ACTN|nr:YceI family protein [Streptomyces sp. RG38]MBQ0829876.1 YceI family protein [Streptomyces sp. RG38]